MPSEREVALEAENARLRVELAFLRGEAAAEVTSAAAKDHELAGARSDLATSETLNSRLHRAITDLTESERRSVLLLAELNHRVKNILATVQGIASQTLKGTGGDPRRFAQHFGARLRTLARAHDMLTANGWAPPTIEDAARNALAPWLEAGRAGQIDIRSTCPGLTISPRQAQALVLAFHELATNATKYGALSTPGGRVWIGCEGGPDGGVAIHWTETGGPPVARPPDRRGFGTRMLERGLAMDLGPGSAVELRFEPAGLRVAIRFAPGERVVRRDSSV
jgi:two-component sensor histidine kinase